MKQLLRLSLVLFLMSFLCVGITNAQTICNETPPNDVCGGALEITSSIIGNTCCGSVVGFNPCSLETGVWFYYPQDLEATLLRIQNISIEGGIGIEVYSGFCGSLKLLEKSDCTGFSSRDITIPNCDGIIYIHIASKEEGCGGFQIIASNIQGCGAADTCEEIDTEHQLFPISDESQVCISSCLNYSCLSSCNEKSAWFEINTDEFASKLSLVIGNADFEHNISVFRASDCDDRASLFVCRPVVPGEFIDIDVSPSTLYFVEVSLTSGDPGPFDLCVNAIQNFLDCSSGTIDVNRFENPSGDEKGPFCPGETVEVCYEISFFSDIPGTGNSCQWLQGIVPIVGGGWDLSANNLKNQPLNEFWKWYDDVNYNVPSPVLGLTTNPNNEIILEYGVGGLEAGDVLPGGWWITSPATGCPTDAHPNNSWGVTSPCGDFITVNHCFLLTAKSPTHILDCEDEFETDLSITLFTFADGETGCYEAQLTCSGDPPIRFEGKLDCSTLVEFDLVDDEICSGEFASIPVGIEGGYEIPIIVEVLDPGNTTGANDWIFSTGSGLIPDRIINNSNSIETILYRVSFYEPESTCTAPVGTFEVKVYPEFSIPPFPQIILCDGDSQNLAAPVGLDSYEWFDAVTNEVLSTDANFTFNKEGFYRLEVLRDICTAKELIEVLIIEPLPLALNILDVDVCNNYIGTLPTSIDLQALQQNGVQGQWLNESGSLVSDPRNFECDGLSPGQYPLTFVTTSAMSPCPDTTYNFIVNVESCVCPNLDISAPSDQCTVDEILNLDELKQTTEPGFWIISDGPDVNSLEIIGGDLIINPNTIAGQYTLTHTITTLGVGPLCPISSSVSFMIFQEPSANITPFGVVCNIDTGTDPDFFDLDDLNVSNSSGQWTTTAMNISIDSDNVVDFLNADVQDYEFKFTTDSAIAPCQNQEYSAVITVNDCSCPSVEINALSSQCISEISLFLNPLKVTTEPGYWTITDGPDVSSILIVNNDIRISNASVPGFYTITFNLSNTNIGPDCPRSSSFTFELIERPSAVIEPFGMACNVYTGTLEDFIDLDDYNLSNSPGVWSTNASGISIDNDNVVDFNGASVNDYLFTFRTNSAIAPCTNRSYQMIISVIDCSCPSVAIGSYGNQCISDINLNLNAIKITPEEGTWSVIDGPDLSLTNINVVGSELRIFETTIPGTYTVAFSLTDTNIGPLCPQSSSFTFELIREPLAMIEALGEVCNEDTGTLPDFIDLDDYNLSNSSGDWSTSEMGITIDNDNIVDFFGASLKDYLFTFTTNDAKAPCVDQTYQMLMTVQDCSCPNVDIGSYGNQCIADINLNLEAIRITTEEGTWSVGDGPDLTSTNIAIVGSELQIFENTIPGIYTIAFNLTDTNIGPDCPKSSHFVFELFEEPSAIIEPLGEVCNEDTGTLPDFIDLDDYNLSNSLGVWSTNESGITIDNDNVVNFLDAEVKDYLFTFNTNTASLPCTDQSYQMLITVKDCSCPSVEIGSYGNQCIADISLNLDAIKITTEEGTWSVTDGPDLASMNMAIVGEELQIFENTLPGIYTITFNLINTNIGPDCPLSSNFDFELFEEPSASIEPFGEVCNEDTGTLPEFIDLDDFNMSNSLGVWSTNETGISIDNENVVNFFGAEVKDYLFTFNTNSANAPCTDQSYQMMMTVRDCSCPSIAIGSYGNQCISNINLDLDAIKITSEDGTWSVASGPDLSPTNIAIVGDELQLFENSMPGVYAIEFNLTDTDVGPDCPLSSNFVFELFAEPAANIEPSGVACNEYTGTDQDFLDLDDFNLSGAFGEWTTLESNISIDQDNIVSFSGKPIQDYTFTFTTNTAQSPCLNQAYTTVISLRDCSCPSVEINPLGNQCIEAASFDLNAQKVTSEDGTWSIITGPDVSSIEVLGAQLNISNNAVPGIYTIQFELQNQNIGPLCPTTSEFQIELFEKPLVDILPQITACNATGGFDPEFIDLDDLNLNNAPGVWSTQHSEVFIDGDNVVDFTGVTIQNYNFVFTTNSALAPCDEEVRNAIVSVRNCECPTLVLGIGSDFCIDNQSFDLDNFIVNAEAGYWSLIGSSNNPPTIQNGILEILETSDAGDYILRYTLDDTNVPSNCVPFDELSFSLFETPEANVIESADVCNAFIGSLETTFDLDDLFISGANGRWISTDALLTIDGNNKVDFTGITAGDYQFIYKTNTANQPCQDVEYDVFISVKDCVCPAIEIASIGDLCNSGATIILSDILTASEAGSWSILAQNVGSTPEIFNQSEIRIITSSEADSYTLTYTLNDTNQPSLCSISESIEFTIFDQPEVEIIEAALACNIDGSIAASDVIDLDDMFMFGDIGEWSTNSGINISVGNSVSFNGAPVGDYLFVYRTNSAISPCVDVERELVITVENCVCPPLAFGSIPTLCNDDNSFDLNSLLLNGVGAGNWMPTSGPEITSLVGGSSFEFNGLQGGDYGFNYTLANAVPAGCQNSAGIIIPLNEAPELNVTPEITVCNTSSSLAPMCIDLNVLMNGDMGSWAAPGSYTGNFSNTGNVCFEGISEGTQFEFSYTTSTAQVPCTNKTESLRVTVIDCTCPNLEVNDPSPLCSLGGVINLNDLETPNTVLGDWSFVDGPQSYNLGSNETFDAVGMLAGNYTFMFVPVQTPETSCPQSNMVQVEVITPLSAGIGNTLDFCEGTDETVGLYNLLDNAEQGGTWTEVSTQVSNGSAFNSTSAEFSIMDQKPGIYEFKYQHLGFEPCEEAEAIVVVIIIENPISDAGESHTITCSLSQVELGGPNLSTGSNIMYEWTELSGKVIDNPTLKNPIVRQAGTYKVVVTDIVFGCQSEDEVTINEDIGIPTFEAEVVSINCEGEEGGSLVIQNSAGGDGQYIYSIDNGANWTENKVFADLKPGSYSIILQDGNGCEALLTDLVVEEGIDLNIDLGDDVEIAYGTDYYPLEVLTSALPEEIESITWEQEGEIICEGDYNTCSIISVDPEGVTLFCVSVVDINGCEETDCITITEVLEVNVFLPSVFTPESYDGNNTFFVQSDENIKAVKSLRVFDRWGSQLFEAETDHMPNNPSFGWDGRWKDKEVKQGIFTYHVVVIDALDEEHSFAGSITLLR